ncbi:MAG: nitrite reductase small subunit NirD [Rhizobiaceae bacterium]
MSTWIDIAALDDIQPRGARVIKTQHGCVAVFRAHDDRVYAIDDACPHKKGPLSEGIVHGNAVTCPLHNWVINLETGMAQGADDGRVNTYEIKVEDGRVLLDCERLITATTE